MKLDRNLNPDGRGKYALVLMREETTLWKRIHNHGLDKVLVSTNAIDFGSNPDTEFFVIRLKDKFAAPALLAYSLAAREAGQTEWADEVFRLAEKAANHPNKKMPT